MRNLIAVLLLCALLFTSIDINCQFPQAFSTFHCISLYWKLSEGAADNECRVKYRAEGETEWKEGMSLWYDPNSHEGLPDRSLEYRGSILDLVPGTNYEIKLELVKTGNAVSLFQSTLSESFPVKSTIVLPSGEFNEPLVIDAGGSETEGYVLYTVAEGGRIIDVKKQSEYCILVNAPYVIIKGFVLKGAGKNGIYLNGASHVVIEDCDISGWGSVVESGKYAGYGADTEAAVSSRQKETSHIIIQRNKLHHPSTSANSWELPVPGTHPQGPQGITLKYTKGYNIIRYNEIFSDSDHRFNDGMGSVLNNSFTGFPHRDSDIYCNLISHCWDDAIEAEGAGMNVRIWGNFVDTTYMAYGLAPQSLGPIYVFRNLSNFTQRAPFPVEKYNRGGSLFKIGAEPVNYKFAKGRLILMHNTSLQPPTPWTSGPVKAGTEQGLLFSNETKVQDNIYTRNNILHVRTSTNPSLRDHKLNPSNSYDYDLYNGYLTAVSGSQQNGIFGEPKYDLSNLAGEYYLATRTPGHDDGLVVPNINTPYAGNAPDRGAFEKGLPPVHYGIHADWNSWVISKNALPANNKIHTEMVRDQDFFSVFPNPVSEILTIRFWQDSDNFTLTLVNVEGRRIYKTALSSYFGQEVSYDTKEWGKGVFFVSIYSSKGIYNKKVIIS